MALHNTISFRSRFPLWWRYFFSSFFLLVTTLLCISYTLFVVVDLVSHGKEFFDTSTPFHVWKTYYVSMFFYRLDTLLPFSITTATAILLPKLLSSNELLPLLNAGISLREIIKPFFAVALLSTIVLYANYQFFYPKALRKYHACSDTDFGNDTLPNEPDRLGIVLFKEGSRLFFKNHDTVEKSLSDVFWVRSVDCVLHIEKLNYFLNRHPDGYGVDVIERRANGVMVKTASYPFCELPELNFTRRTLRLATADPKELSLSQLHSLSTGLRQCASQRATETSIAFWSKLTTPLLAIIAFLLPLPLCFRFERRFPQALIVLYAFCSVFLFLLITQACTILARVPLVPVMPVILFPWALLLIYTYKKRPKTL